MGEHGSSAHAGRIHGPARMGDGRVSRTCECLPRSNTVGLTCKVGPFDFPHDPRRLRLIALDSADSPLVEVLTSSETLDHAVRRAVDTMATVVDRDGDLLLTDNLFINRRALVIVEPRPFVCAAAIDRSMSVPHIVGVITTVRLGDLPAVLAAVRAGLVVVGPDVKSCAEEAPALTARQLQVLGEVMTGSTNHDVAKRLYVSDATVKRELAAISKMLGATGRFDIASRACRLGFDPSRTR